MHRLPFLVKYSRLPKYHAHCRRAIIPWCVYYVWSVSNTFFILWISFISNGGCCISTDDPIVLRTLQWRHNGHDSVPNQQPHDCLLNRLFRRRSKKTAKLRVTGLCAGNSPRTGEFPAQMASNADNISIWWRHHEGDIISVHHLLILITLEVWNPPCHFSSYVPVADCIWYSYIIIAFQLNYCHCIIWHVCDLLKWQALEIA